MDLQLAGLNAVVTGGSSGIGLAVVKALAAEACHVAFCGRDANRVAAAQLHLTGQNLPGRVDGIALDVRDTAGSTAWLSKVAKVDILVLNASALSQDWNRAIELDLVANLNFLEAALPYLMRSPCGAITYVGSKATSMAEASSSGYGAMKAAMVHYMKSLSLRLLPNVRVNAVSPGDTLTETGLWQQAKDHQPDAYAQVVQRNPMGRLASPDEIARVVAFVCSPAASFVAGANWYVDGGATLHVPY